MTNRKLMRWFGDEWGGNTCPPGDNLRLEYGPLDEGRPCYVALVNEGAASLWIGYPDRWLTHMTRSDARKLAWFILWRWWVRSEWFGLRRKVWYWALHRYCADIRKHPKVNP